MNLKEFKKELFKNAKFAKEYSRDDLAFHISSMVAEARISKNITQNQLAKKVGTTQSGVARMERGDNLPSLTSLKKVAEALGEKLYVDFKSNKDIIFLASNFSTSDRYTYGYDKKEEFLVDNHAQDDSKESPIIVNA